MVQHMADRFGISLAADKSKGPSPVMSFLGILIDTMAMECRLPDDRLMDLWSAVVWARKAGKLILHQLQSLLGKLNIACRITPMGRVFNRRLAAATAGIRRMRCPGDLTQDHKVVLLVWESFLDSYNGRSVWMSEAMSSFDLELFTNAAGSAGYGACFGGQWSAGPLPLEWREAGFTKNWALLEFFPILLAAEIWGLSSVTRRSISTVIMWRLCRRLIVYLLCRWCVCGGIWC